jgi:hypothetical protein
MVHSITIGQACFVCESDENTHELDDDNLSTCPNCSPMVTFEITQGQRILSHIGAHILHDPKVDRSSEPCGLCLQPSPMCQFYLKKGKGAKGTLKINHAASKGCPNLIKFSYGTASRSSKSSPCSNVPIRCPLCSSSDPAVWKYNMKFHFKLTHPSAPLSKYDHLWLLSSFEKSQLAGFWKDRYKVTVKRPNKKNKVSPLQISEAHSSRLALR